MAWETDKRYRFRVVKGEHTIRQIQTTGTVTVEVMWECVHGSESGQRVRWQGYLNSEKNTKDAIEQLRAMGWTGGRFGDWAGMGSREFEGSVLFEFSDGKKYPRGAFARQPSTVHRGDGIKTSTLDAINGRFGALLAGDAAEPSPDEPAPAAAGDELPF